MVIFRNPLWAEQLSPDQGLERLSFENRATEKEGAADGRPLDASRKGDDSIIYNTDSSADEKGGDLEQGLFTFHDGESISTSLSSSLDFHSFQNSKSPQQKRPMQCTSKVWKPYENKEMRRQLDLKKKCNDTQQIKKEQTVIDHIAPRDYDQREESQVYVPSASANMPEKNQNLNVFQVTLDEEKDLELCRDRVNDFYEIQIRQMGRSSLYVNDGIQESRCSPEGYESYLAADQHLPRKFVFNGVKGTGINKQETPHSEVHDRDKGRSKNMDTLSFSQEMDFPFQNSDALAAFEMEEFCKLEKRIWKEIEPQGRNGLHQDIYEAYIDESLNQQMHSPQSSDNMTPSDITNTRVMVPEQLDQALEVLCPLNVRRGSNVSGKVPHGTRIMRPSGDVTKATTTESENSSMLSLMYSLHESESDGKKCKLEKVTKENQAKESRAAVTDKKMRVLEEELLELQKQNKRLERLLKDDNQNKAKFEKEKALWRQKKEEEMRQLRRERAKLEKDAKLLSHLPSKKERNEVEELRTKIANITADHLKQDSLQCLTINRLRRTIGDLTEQICALKEEVKRYERCLQTEWDANADNRQKSKLPNSHIAGKMGNSLLMSDQKVQNLNYITLKHKDLQSVKSWSRCITPMHWTKA